MLSWVEYEKSFMTLEQDVSVPYNDQRLACVEFQVQIVTYSRTYW